MDLHRSASPYSCSLHLSDLGEMVTRFDTLHQYRYSEPGKQMFRLLICCFSARARARSPSESVRSGSPASHTQVTCRTKAARNRSSGGNDTCNERVTASREIVGMLLTGSNIGAREWCSSSARRHHALMDEVEAIELHSDHHDPRFGRCYFKEAARISSAVFTDQPWQPSRQPPR